MMATSQMIDMACQTDEQLRKIGVGPSPLADTRHIVGATEVVVDPLEQARAARWLRRHTPDGWREMLNLLGLPEGGPLTLWPADGVDREQMVVCLAEVRIHEARVEEAEPDVEDDQDGPPLPAAPAPKRRPDKTWMDRAACKTVEAEVFFPHDTDRYGEEVAKLVCGGCRVRNACLEYALATRQKYGVWGGETLAGRKNALRRKARLAVVERVEPEVESEPVVAVREKQCTRCGVIQPATDFSKDKLQKDGLNRWCRGCSADAAHRRRLEAKQAVAS